MICRQVRIELVRDLKRAIYQVLLSVICLDSPHRAEDLALACRLHRGLHTTSTYVLCTQYSQCSMLLCDVSGSQIPRCCGEGFSFTSLLWFSAKKPTPSTIIRGIVWLNWAKPIKGAFSIMSILCT
jgi:hypothetical protein